MAALVLNQDAIEATAARFPDLVEEHLITVLEHIHIQAYQRPFSQSTD